MKVFLIQTFNHKTYDQLRLVFRITFVIMLISLQPQRATKKVRRDELKNCTDYITTVGVIIIFVFNSYEPNQKLTKKFHLSGYGAIGIHCK